MLNNLNWANCLIIFLLTILIIRTLFPETKLPRVVSPPHANGTQHVEEITVITTITPTPCPTVLPTVVTTQPPEPAKVNYSVANRYCSDLVEERQPWNFHKRVIAFSLFPNSTGVIPDFLIHGLRQNIIAIKQVFPEWLLRLYVIRGNEEFFKEFGSHPLVEIVKCVDAPTSAKKMLWRFLVYDDPKVAISMSRDLDGRLSYREMFAVHEWMSTGLGFHAIRDHPFHVIPIMGGFFGMRRGVFKGEKMENLVTEALRLYPGTTGIPGCCADDQNFLTTFVWPKVSGDALSTDSSVGRCFGAKMCRDFPVGPRTDTNFIGSPFKESKTAIEKCELTCKWL